MLPLCSAELQLSLANFLCPQTYLDVHIRPSLSTSGGCGLYGCIKTAPAPLFVCVYVSHREKKQKGSDFCEPPPTFPRLPITAQVIGPLCGFCVKWKLSFCAQPHRWVGGWVGHPHSSSERLLGSTLRTRWSVEMITCRRCFGS